MDTGGAITYAQMDHFLKTQLWSTPQQAFTAAAERFSGGCPAPKTPVFPSDCDIIFVPDEEFISMCDGLPVSSFFMDTGGQLNAAALFPPNYECFVIRHLNALRADIHRHDFFELCYVWEGSCTQITAEAEFPMGMGDFILIPPGIDHRVEVDDDRTVLFNIMVRRDAFFSSCLSLLTQKNPVSAFLSHSLFNEPCEKCLLFHVEETKYVHRIIKHLTMECYTEQDILCDFSIGVFNQLFCCILLSGEVKDRHPDLPKNLPLIAVLREIQRNYQTVTLRSLSEQFFFSEEHLSRLIRRHTGSTFSELLRQTRISKARTLLSRTELSVDKIAEFVGYGDSSSFSKAFRACTGQTPAQYRHTHSDK